MPGVSQVLPIAGETYTHDKLSDGHSRKEPKSVLCDADVKSSDLAQRRLQMQDIQKELDSYQFQTRAGVIYFVDTEHSELFIDERLYYFINSRNLKPKDCTKSIAINRSKEHRCRSKLYHIPMTARQLAELNTDIEMKRYPHVLNTCMGGVAELLNRHSDVYFPPVVRQFPSVSASYMDATKKLGFKAVGKVTGDSPEVMKTQLQKSVVMLILYFAIINAIYTSVLAGLDKIL